MEFLIELLLELVLEGSIELSSNRKVPKWIRYPLIVIITLFFGIVIFGMLFLGAYILKENVLAGIIIMAIGLILLIAGISKFKKIYMEKRRSL